MKKLIAIAMSGLLALSSVSVAAVAEPVVPSVSVAADMAWSQNARPVSAEELAQIRSQFPEKSVLPEDQEDDVQTGHGVITGPVIEAVMSISQEAAVDPESQVEPPVLAQITASMAVLEYREGYEYRVTNSNSVTPWQTGNIFDTLTANQEYSVQQRLTGRADTESEPLVIHTLDRSPCSLPTAEPMVERVGRDLIWLIARKGYEYRINKGSWQDSASFSNLKPNTEYVIQQRIKETPDEYASEPTELHVKTIAQSGPSSFKNFDRLAEYIQANGFEDDLGTSSVAYSVDIDENNTYYFVISNRVTTILCNVFNVSADGTYIAFDTTFLIPKYNYPMYPHSFISFCYEEEWIEEVDVSGPTTYAEDYTDFCFDTVDGNSAYLPDDAILDLFNSTMAMAASFWDEVIYDELGFGLKGLGFLSYNGYGEAYCALGSGIHIGTPVVLERQEPGCECVGRERMQYCSVCNEIIEDPIYIPAKGSHEYDHDCDPDCNVCGELRRIQHIYSFACATECDLCGAIRTEPLAEHHFDENRVCTSCGEKLGLIGDVTGDGNVNMGDISRIYAHVKGSVLLTDSAVLATADVTGDGNINMGDVSRLAAHVSGRVPLW